MKVDGVEMTTMKDVEERLSQFWMRLRCCRWTFAPTAPRSGACAVAGPGAPERSTSTTCEMRPTKKLYGQ